MRGGLKAMLAFVLVTCASVLAFAAIDLVLPAIPVLPRLLGGSTAQGQYVLAAFTAGLALGLPLFGELGSRLPQRPLLAGALALFGLVSLAATQVAAMPQLIALRLVQGVFAAAPAVFAPGIIRAVFDDPRAVRAIGLQGSVEALAPALAPVAGAWLLLQHGWASSFVVLGGIALVLAGAVACLPAQAFPAPHAAGASMGGYAALLRNRGFLRFGLSQALTLGAMLVIVMAAPVVIVGSMGGTLAHFIAMQMSGVAAFIVAANLAPRLAERFGDTRLIVAGTGLAALAACAILGMALAGGRDPRLLALLFVPLNMGFGLRGPTGFLAALVAARGDDARAAALVVLAILLITAAGTAGIAPWIEAGLLPVAATAAGLALASVAVVLGLRVPRA